MTPFVAHEGEFFQTFGADGSELRPTDGYRRPASRPPAARAPSSGLEKRLDLILDLGRGYLDVD